MNLLGGRLPSIVYLPASIRARKTRMTADGVVTSSDLTAEEQLDRIVQADPIGFLIAVMNGQPIPTFRLIDASNPAPKKNRKQNPQTAVSVGKDGDAEVLVEFHVPSIADRERIALYLADRIAGPKKLRTEKPSGTASTDEFSSLVSKRAREMHDEVKK